MNIENEFILNTIKDLKILDDSDSLNLIYDAIKEIKDEKVKNELEVAFEEKYYDLIEEVINDLTEIDKEKEEKINNYISMFNNEDIKNQLYNKLDLKIKSLKKSSSNNNGKKINIKALAVAGAMGASILLGSIILANKPGEKTNEDGLTNGSSTTSIDNNVLPDNVSLDSIIFNDSSNFAFDRNADYHYICNGTEEFFGLQGLTNGTQIGDSNIYSSPKNVNHDQFEYDIQKLESMIVENNIPMQEFHSTNAYGDEAGLSNIFESDIENKNVDQYSNNIKIFLDDPSFLFATMWNYASYNENAKNINMDTYQNYSCGLNDWLTNNQDGYSPEMNAVLIDAMEKYRDYRNNYERTLATYCVTNNVKVDEGEKALREQFLNADPNDTSVAFYSQYQAQRFVDCYYTIFCNYYYSVGEEQFKNDYYYLFGIEKQLVK